MEQHRGGGAGSCGPGVCLQRQVEVPCQWGRGRRSGSQLSKMLQLAQTSHQGTWAGPGPGSRGSLSRSNLRPHIPLPRFTDDDADPERDMTHVELDPGLEL